MRHGLALMTLVTAVCVEASGQEADAQAAAPPGAARAVTRRIEHDAVVVEFGQAYADATVENTMSSKVESRFTADGLETWRIFLHPPAQPADGRARITFPAVDLPEITPPEKLEIRFGASLGVDIGDKEGADGVVAIVKVGDRELIAKVVTGHELEAVRADISAWAGQRVVFSFETDMRGNSMYDQAWLDAPKVVVAGRRVTTTVTIPVHGIEPGVLAPANLSQTTLAAADDDSSVLVAVTDATLDLDALVKAAQADSSTQALVPLSPILAAGEGPDEANHTVIRILGRYGIPEVQFLAFPPRVRGGVQVESGHFWADEPCGVAAAPFTSETAEIRLFSRYGGLRTVLEPDVPAPYSMAAGAFLGSSELLAVAPMRPAGATVRVVLFDGGGAEVRRLQVDVPGAEDVSLLARTVPDGVVLLLHRTGAPTARALDCRTGRATDVPLGGVPTTAGLYASAFGNTHLLAAGPEPALSHIYRLDDAAQTTPLDVGTRENCFWYAASGAHAGEDSKWGEIPAAKHVRTARFAHIRTDMHAARALGESPELRQLLGFDEWREKGLLAGALGRSADYDAAVPTCWEPCFTHRWLRDFTNILADEKDPKTGLHRYVVLDRGNRPLSYREFDNAGFNTGTYAFGIPDLDRMYIYPIRAFMQELAVHHRANPEHFVAVEPNHEHEIVSSEKDQASLGDYNPKNLEGFYAELIHRHGSLEAVNRLYGTPFSPTFFDAPRDRGRGTWDRYADDNPLYQEWFRYNAAVVCRRIAETWREGLLAGMPPESLTCHQIPDAYAISSLTAFSKPVNRITPIDWMLTAGTGYGFTRYGVWFKQERNCLQGAWSSGHGMVTVGEYSALATQPEDAYGQLMYLQQHGTMFIHCMWWPAEWEKGRGYNDTFKYALRRMAKEDPVRLGVTGGVLMARPFDDGDRTFDIVSIGTGPERNGLLKSVRADGSWEGSVYVVPFHAHVDVKTVLEQPLVSVTEAGLRTPAVDDMSSGTQLEISFRVVETTAESLTIDVVHGEDILPGQRLLMPLSAGRHCRTILRFQHAMGPIRLDLRASEGRVQVRDLAVTRHRDAAARIREGEFVGTRHRGGATFCVVE